ncbi:hypothetical protein KNP414_02095 [Paenibacillus mucilaginosus KNP414]|uniref:Uncharacterized protein n=1 Tax=Paenibacillus mucilaginosus (strain KNP414) TaxID=1036673 RepID=F8FRU9_PAEMK|nr:hypothetical protein KNP414_02095 [Paenibacillus mucilaginosus KNP414]
MAYYDGALGKGFIPLIRKQFYGSGTSASSVCYYRGWVE